jgi:hypothetical protein
LGSDAASERIRRSGLWNVDHLNSTYDPGFLERLEALIYR